MMQVLISGKYMLLPVNTRSAAKRVCLWDKEELLFDFSCKIDNLHPNFTAYMDVSAFRGKTVELTVEPMMSYQPCFAEEMDLPELWHEPLRPQVHFTVKNGWTNDPNGLIYVDGVYHMFYQCNPAAAEWENMHWGHAVSRDLVHWEERDIALFPDALGTMFSGSAIKDSENAAGFGKGAMLLYYTAAGGTSRLSKGKKFTQCLAYSIDGGKNFVKYDQNPILAHREAGNRDPKVVYVEEIGRYIMVIYRAESRYEMLVSDNLLHWEHFQEILLHGDAECPDIFPLRCEGKKLWVLIGAMDVYIVGHFEKDRFVTDNSEKKLTYLRMSYAAQSFSGVPDGRVLRVAWHNLRIPASNFTSQMSFPTEMSLSALQGQYYLSALPAKEIESLYMDCQAAENVSLGQSIVWKVGANPLDISLTAPYVAGEKLTITFFDADLVCDMTQNQIIFKKNKMPLSVCGDRVDLRILVDCCSAEIFADGGKFFFAVPMFADYNLPQLVVHENEKLTVEKLECHTLRSIYA